MGRLYSDLKEGLEECIAYEKGKITLRSDFIEIPESPEEYTAPIEWSPPLISIDFHLFFD